MSTASRGRTRLQAERSGVSRGRVLGKLDASRGEQINQSGSGGRSVERRRRGPHTQGLAEGFTLRIGGPEGNGRVRVGAG